MHGLKFTYSEGERRSSARGVVLKRKLNQTRQRLTNALFLGVCAVIARWLPPSRWYRTALWLSRFLARSAGRFAPKSNNVNQASLVPRLLHRFLDLLSVHNAFFPIPVRVEGEEILRAYAAQPGGFVCCSAHIPFVKLFLPIARRVLGDRPARVIAREPVGDNEVSAWGDEHWKAIRTDHAVLLHTRTLLRQNGCLTIAVDKEQGEFISANIFRFAGKMNSRILMWFTQLQPDGTILLRILLPPGPLCKSEEEIHANLDFVAENVSRILQGNQIVPAVRPSAAPQDSWEELRSRELNRIQLYTTAQLEERLRRLQAVLSQSNGAVSRRAFLEKRLALLRLELETRTGT